MRFMKKLLATLAVVALMITNLVAPISSAVPQDKYKIEINASAGTKADGAMYKVVQTKKMEDSGQVVDIEEVEIERLTISEGKAETTQALEKGVYQVRPVKRAPGYLLDQHTEAEKYAQVQFPLMENGLVKDNQTFKITTKDRPVNTTTDPDEIDPDTAMGGYEFVKYGDDGVAPLDGVTFELKMTHKPEVIGDDNTVESWTLIDEDEQETNKKTMTTNEDGKVVFADLKEGKYELTEVATKDGYELNSNKNTFTLTVKENKAAIEDLTVNGENKLINYLSPTIEKKILKGEDEEVNDFLINVETPFEYVLRVNLPKDIEDYTVFELEDELSEKLELLNVKKVEVDNVELEELDVEAITTILENNVKLDFAEHKDLLKGKKVLEVFLETQIRGNVTELGSISNTFKLTYNNGKVEDQDDKVIESNDTGETTNVKPTMGSVEFVKTTSDGETPLAGAKFKIFKKGEITETGEKAIEEANTKDAFKNPVTGLPYEVVVSANGQEDTGEGAGLVKFENLPFGEYEIYEIEAPANYNVKMDPIEVNVTGDTEVVELVLDNVPNYKYEENVPGTGTMGASLFAVAGITAIGTGAFLKKKKEEDK